MQYFKLSLIFAIMWTISLPVSADIHVTQSSVKISSGMGKAAAIFMTIKNNTDISDRLMAVKTSVAKKSMLHDTIVTSDGIVKMMHIMKGVEVKKGEEVVLKSGGRHIMLMGLTETLEPGRVFKLVLSFKNAGDLDISVTVGEEK